jgi:hypothetical protein
MVLLSIVQITNNNKKYCIDLVIVINTIKSTIDSCSPKLKSPIVANTQHSLKLFSSSTVKKRTASVLLWSGAQIECSRPCVQAPVGSNRKL